jgi:hypothetical protein
MRGDFSARSQSERSSNDETNQKSVKCVRVTRNDVGFAQGKSGIVTQFITRAQAIRRLQVSLQGFRYVRHGHVRLD